MSVRIRSTLQESCGAHLLRRLSAPLRRADRVLPWYAENVNDAERPTNTQTSKRYTREMINDDHPAGLCENQASGKL